MVASSRTSGVNETWASETRERIMMHQQYWFGIFYSVAICLQSDMLFVEQFVRILQNFVEFRLVDSLSRFYDSIALPNLHYEPFDDLHSTTPSALLFVANCLNLDL